MQGLGANWGFGKLGSYRVPKEGGILDYGSYCIRLEILGENSIRRARQAFFKFHWHFRSGSKESSLAIQVANRYRAWD